MPLLGLMAVYGGLLYLAITHIDWRALAQDGGLQHRIGMAIVLLVVIWSMRAGINEEIQLHFFLVSALHLVMGWQLAMLIVAIVILVMVSLGEMQWMYFGLNGMAIGVVPIVCTFLLWKWHKKHTPNNPFAFIFLVAFAGAVLASVCSGIFRSVLLLASGLASLAQVEQEIWMVMPLMAIPEGVVNGMLITGLIVFRPNWVRLFDESRYQ